MPSVQTTAYRLSDSFRRDLRATAQAADPAASFRTAIIRFLRIFNAESSVIVTRTGLENPRRLAHAVVAGRPLIWPEYIELCRTNRDPLSRLVRLSPYPVALSDLRNKPQLEQRTRPLTNLLARDAMDDIFAVRASVDDNSRFAMLLIAGRNLRLRPTNRHLLALVAADIAAYQLATLSAPSEAGRAPHLQLTSRQLEIANWLVAGKTDWEIGEILNISPKTVNFHVENIKRIYGVRSRNQFVAAIVHDGGLAPLARPRELSRA